MAERWAATRASFGHLAGAALAHANAVIEWTGPCLSLSGNSTTSDRSISRSRRTLMEEMPRKSAAELEGECLRLLAMDPHTQGIKRVEIIRLYPNGAESDLRRA